MLQFKDINKDDKTGLYIN